MMATLFSVITVSDLTQLFDLTDLYDIECLAGAMGVFGVHQLFEVDGQQRETVCLTHDADGNPVIKLRHGGVITRAVAEQLNTLIGETYHKGRVAVLSCDDDAPLTPPNAP
ncbi:MAG: hypothetical protein JO296_21230 [Pseudonocardiales bacterium]|nr:hypothetical protein [Pseudonocardiales bacterium]